MTTVVMERGFNAAIDERDFQLMSAGLADCVMIYRAHWLESFLALDGTSLTCCFTAPDTESIRMMSRGDASDRKQVWAGTAHAGQSAGLANVAVERRFEAPVTLESLQALENAANWCLQQHKVTFLRTYFSADRKNMVCLYDAPDAESVRIAQQQAGMPFNRVWSCRNYTPDNLPGSR
jgi:hypothetical protein